MACWNAIGEGETKGERALGGTPELCNTIGQRHDPITSCE